MQGVNNKDFRELRPCSGERTGSQVVIPLRNESGKRVFDAKLDPDGNIVFVVKGRNIDACITLEEIESQLLSYRSEAYIRAFEKN